MRFSGPRRLSTGDGLSLRGYGWKLVHHSFVNAGFRGQNLTCHIPIVSSSVVVRPTAARYRLAQNRRYHQAGIRIGDRRTIQGASLTKRVEPHDSLYRLEDGNPDAEEDGQRSRAHTAFAARTARAGKRSAGRSSKAQVRVVDDALVQVR